MIQRIQTLFLLLSIAALAAFQFVPVIAVESKSFNDFFVGWSVGHSIRVGSQPYIYFFNAIFSGTAIGLSLLTIVFFKYRRVQMMLCWFSIVLITAAEAYVYYKYQTRVFNGDVILTWWNLLPIGAVILQILSIIYIRKDETLLKSMDRLR